jgi:hypothetical protein
MSKGFVEIFEWYLLEPEKYTEVTRDAEEEKLNTVSRVIHERSNVALQTKKSPVLYSRKKFRQCPQELTTVPYPERVYYSSPTHYVPSRSRLICSSLLFQILYSIHIN